MTAAASLGTAGAAVLLTALLTVLGAAPAFATPGWVDWEQKISDTAGNFTGVLDDSDYFGTSLAALGDLDGGGAGDLAVGAWADDDGGLARGAVWVLFLDTDGTVNSHQKISDAADAPFSVFAADVDGDGDLDVLSASQDDDKIAWYDNTDGAGSFGSRQVISTAADEARSVFAADVDGDGDLDALSASVIDDKIAWYENTDGAGSFGSQQVISTGPLRARSLRPPREGARRTVMCAGRRVRSPRGFERHLFVYEEQAG